MVGLRYTCPTLLGLSATDTEIFLRFFPPRSGVHPMLNVDQRYDEAIELQQAGKLEEAVGKLESLVVDHSDYALAHAALGVFFDQQHSDDGLVH